MSNYTPKEMAVSLCRCADGICDDSCPCAEVLEEAEEDG